MPARSSPRWTSSISWTRSCPWSGVIKDASSWRQARLAARLPVPRDGEEQAHVGRRPTAPEEPHRVEVVAQGPGRGRNALLDRRVADAECSALLPDEPALLSQWRLALEYRDAL